MNDGMKRAADAVGRLTRRGALMLGVAAFAGSVLTAPAVAEEQVNVGVIVPLSGANAQFGINSRNGIELVADEINEAGGIEALGGAKINLIVADATSSPTQAATVAQRMLSQDKVVAVLGAFASSLTLGISEVTERRGVPLLTMSFSDRITDRGFKNVFQIVPVGSRLGGATFDYTVELAKENGEDLQRVAIMYEDTAYGTSQAEGLRAAAKEAGIEVVMDEAYPLGVTDVSPLINQLRRSDAQVVFPVSYLNDSLLIVRSMRQQGIDIPTIGGAAGYIIPNFKEGLGELTENVLSIAPTAYDQAPEYAKRFKDRYGYFMVHEAQEHAALMGVLAQALENTASRDPAKLSEDLHKQKFDSGWASVMTGGVVEFDEKGRNPNAVPLMVQWRGSDLVTVYPEDYATSEAVWNKTSAGD